MDHLTPKTVFLPQAPADVNRELNTLLSANSSNVLEVLRRFSIVSSTVEGERMCLRVLWPVSSLYQVWEGLLHDWKTGGSQMDVWKAVSQTPGSLDLDCRVS